MTEKIDHSMADNLQQTDSGNGAPLGRQMTVTLSSEQYERLFFQPSAPRRGDAAKRFANPTLLGLIGFLIPYTSTVLTLCQFAGAIPPYTLVGLSGDYYFLGAIAMNLAGIGEFILGNTFPFAVFVIYGCHWGSLAYTQDPIHQTTVEFTANNNALGGATGAPYQSSQAFHNVTMCICSFVLLIGTIRVNAFFTLTFFGLVGLFASIAAADFAAPNATTPADEEHILHLLKIAGGFGFIGLISGWYLAILSVCEAVAIPLPLPVLDLSHLVFPPKNRPQVKDHEG